MDNLELEKLQVLADETDNANGAPIVGADGAELPPAPPPRDYATEASGAVAAFAALVTGYAPATAELWDEAAKQRIAAALSPVMEKYQFSLGALPVELTLIIVAGPVLYQTSKVVALQMAQQKALAQKDKPETPQTARQAMPQESPELMVHPQTKLYQ